MHFASLSGQGQGLPSERLQKLSGCWRKDGSDTLAFSLLALLASQVVAALSRLHDRTFNFPCLRAHQQF